MAFSDLSRGAQMYFIESIFQILNCILVGYHIYAEFENAKRIGKRIALKSIPFITFSFLEVALLLRVAQGFVAYAKDVDNPYSNNTFWILFIWGAHCYAVQFFWLAFCWIKLIIVFVDTKSIEFQRGKYVDMAMFAWCTFTTIFYVILSIVVYAAPGTDWDIVWRLGLGVILLLSVLIFLVYGSKLLKVFESSQKNIDIMLVKKMKGMFLVISSLGVVSVFLPNAYWIWARERAPQDWVNFALFITEILDVYSFLIIIGRSKLAGRLRRVFNYPDLIVSSDETVSQGGSIGLSSNRASKNSAFTSSQKQIEDESANVSSVASSAPQENTEVTSIEIKTDNSDPTTDNNEN